MNATEAVTICRLVKAICPQQAMDEHTPQAWALLLETVRIEDAKQAVINLGKMRPFIAPSEVIAEVKAIRVARLRKHGSPIPPAGLDVVTELAWRREALRRVADGETVAGPVYHEIDHERRANELEAGRGNHSVIAAARANIRSTITHTTEETA